MHSQKVFKMGEQNIDIEEYTGKNPQETIGNIMGRIAKLKEEAARQSDRAVYKLTGAGLLPVLVGASGILTPVFSGKGEILHYAAMVAALTAVNVLLTGGFNSRKQSKTAEKDASALTTAFSTYLSENAGQPQVNALTGALAQNLLQAINQPGIKGLEAARTISSPKSVPVSQK